MISIQQSAGTFAKGYRAMPLRTGYEQIIAHRTDDLFAYTAKQDGDITAKTDKVIEVTYKDGSTFAVQLGKRYGTGAGITFPHEVKSLLSVGDKVKKGDIISFNENYFEIDPLNKKQVLLKTGTLVTTAILESVDTLEDSSAISEKAAKLMETKVTYIRNIIVSFDQTIHNLVMENSPVDPESILCTIEDALTADSKLFDSTSLDTLKLLGRNTPRSKYKGNVEKIEVFYNGDIDDMSPSLQDLAQESNRERKRLARDMKTKYSSGRVDEGMRIDGEDLPFEHAVIKVYITSAVENSTGDRFKYIHLLQLFKWLEVREIVIKKYFKSVLWSRNTSAVFSLIAGISC